MSGLIVAAAVAIVAAAGGAINPDVAYFVASILGIVIVMTVLLRIEEDESKTNLRNLMIVVLLVLAVSFSTFLGRLIYALTLSNYP